MIDACDDERLQIVTRLANAAYAVQNPALHIVRLSLFLTSWSLPILVADIEAMIASIHEGLRVTVGVCDSGSWRPIDWSRSNEYLCQLRDAAPLY